MTPALTPTQKRGLQRWAALFRINAARFDRGADESPVAPHGHSQHGPDGSKPQVAQPAQRTASRTTHAVPSGPEVPPPTGPEVPLTPSSWSGAPAGGASSSEAGARVARPIIPAARRGAEV